MSSFVIVKTAVRGYHVYEVLWEPRVEMNAFGTGDELVYHCRTKCLRAGDETVESWRQKLRAMETKAFSAGDQAFSTGNQSI